MDEERGMRNWWKRRQKLVNAGVLKPEGIEKFKELVTKAKLVYVHEIQHWLRRHHQEDGLRINESRS